MIRARFALLLALLVVSSAAQAQQVSDADRAAARELYVAGVKAQDAGRFAEALDHFQRAQSVFSAPTHLLHIAECEAALGKLVESAETYRTLVRTPLPAGAPNAFVQAQQQGNAELPQVEPRIPSIRVYVKPDNVQNLQVQVDGQSMSAALVGVQRPTDPGAHTITVWAPGYAKTEQKVTLKEKEQKDVPITLVASSASAGGGIVYTPAPPQGPGPANTANGVPPPYDQGAPPPYEAPPERKPASGGFMIGPRLGLLAPGGNVVQGTKASSFAGSGVSAGAEGGFRFARRFYIGAVFEHGFHGKGDASNDLAGQVVSGSVINASQSSNYLGVDFVYISNPDGLAFYGEIGLGYRAMTLDLSTPNGADVNPTLSGGEAEIGIGLHFKAGDWVRIVPKISFAGGQYNSLSCSDANGGVGPLNCSGVGGGSSSTITNTDTHTFLFIGATAFFDFARKR